jgi:hypothetical protein
LLDFGPKGIEKANKKYYSFENERLVWDYCKKSRCAYKNILWLLLEWCKLAPNFIKNVLHLVATLNS